MTTLKANSNIGNFQFFAEAEVSDQQRDELANFGLLQLLQRSPATAAEKAMGKFEKRPEGFKRNSIPFNAENAAIVETELSNPIDLGEASGGKFSCLIEVKEYIPSVADVKMADERAAYAKAGAEGRLASVATKVGYKGEVGDGTKENAPADFLRAIRAWKNAQLLELA